MLTDFEKKILDNKEAVYKLLFNVFPIKSAKYENYNINIREDRVTFSSFLLDNLPIIRLTEKQAKTKIKNFVLAKKKEFQLKNTTYYDIPITILFPKNIVIEKTAIPKSYYYKENTLCYRVTSKEFVNQKEEYDFIFCITDGQIISIYFPFHECQYYRKKYNSVLGFEIFKGSGVIVKKTYPLLKINSASTIDVESAKSINQINNTIHKIHSSFRNLLKDMALTDHLLNSFMHEIIKGDEITYKYSNISPDNFDINGSALGLEISNSEVLNIKIKEFKVDSNASKKNSTNKKAKAYLKSLGVESYKSLTNNEDLLKKVDKAINDRIKRIDKSLSVATLFSEPNEQYIKLKNNLNKYRKGYRVFKKNILVKALVTALNYAPLKLLFSSNPFTLCVSILITYFLDELTNQFFEEPDGIKRLKKEFDKTNYYKLLDEHLTKTSSNLTSTVIKPILEFLINTHYEIGETNSDNKENEQLDLLLIIEQSLLNTYNSIENQYLYFHNLLKEFEYFEDSVVSIPQWWKLKFIEEQELIDKILNKIERHFDSAVAKEHDLKHRPLANFYKTTFQNSILAYVRHKTISNQFYAKYIHHNRLNVLSIKYGDYNYSKRLEIYIRKLIENGTMASISILSVTGELEIIINTSFSIKITGKIIENKKEITCKVINSSAWKNDIKTAFYKIWPSSKYSHNIDRAIQFADNCNSITKFNSVTSSHDINPTLNTLYKMLGREYDLKDRYIFSVINFNKWIFTLPNFIGKYPDLNQMFSKNKFRFGIYKNELFTQLQKLILLDERMLSFEYVLHFDYFNSERRLKEIEINLDLLPFRFNKVEVTPQKTIINPVTNDFSDQIGTGKILSIKTVLTKSEYYHLDNDSRFKEY